MGLDASARSRFLSRAQSVLAALYPATCTVSGVTCACAENPQTISAENESGGRVYGAVTLIRVPKTSLPTAPPIGAPVDMSDGRKLKISAVSPGSQDIAWTLTLEERNIR
jgi:hypothetical protein